MDLIQKGLIQEMQTNLGNNLLAFTEKKPVLLVFLRHFGCVFCKEALSDLAGLWPDFKGRDIELIFVHMATNKVADKYFKDFELEGVQHISDPEKQYYYEFGLRKGSFSQLYGLRTWFRGFSSETKQYKLELAQHLGDSTQMPGMFLIKNGEIKESYIHKLASDQPDYMQFLNSSKV